MMTKYKFSKTLEKVGIALVEVAIAGVLAYVTERPELLVLVPIVEGIRNWWKHKN